MNVVFDKASATWCIFDHREGTVLKTGFATDDAAWRWIEEHDEAEDDDSTTTQPKRGEPQ